ncbi:MAG: hypothetical protein RJB62_1179 [Pseudomonadota bacterium]|jgi:uncharacterized surface protein with fasciclin (FAS1) repeats
MRIVTLLAAAATAVVMSVSASQAQDIIEAASANPDLSTFVQAVEAAGLTETLKGEGPFTVFAPNNAAFEALGNGVADRLMGNQAQLAEILGMQILTGEYMSADLQGRNGRYETLNGDRVQVNSMGRGNNGNGAIAIDGNRVVGPDVDATNGVLHVTEGVVH